MKYLPALLLPVLVLLAFSTGFDERPLTITSKSAPKVAKSDQAPFALVELFTSQGCSSCPPADELLAELAERGRAGAAIYPLSYHVDYWNYLGWKDLFSDARFSERQRNYAAALGSRVYTPQLIVNGREEMIGSRRNEAESSVNQALQQAAPAQLSFEYELVSGTAKIDYSMSSVVPLQAAKIIAVVAQRHASSQIKRGENEGRKLEHANVVRAFVEATVAQKGSLSLPLPADLSNFDLIVFLQRADYGAIIAAEKAEVSVKKP